MDLISKELFFNGFDFYETGMYVLRFVVRTLAQPAAKPSKTNPDDTHIYEYHGPPHHTNDIGSSENGPSCYFHNHGTWRAQNRIGGPWQHA